MSTVLVIYHSDTGNTRKLAELVAEGAKGVAGTQVKLVPAGQLDLDAAAKADALAIGSPDYFSYVAGQVKALFDRVLNDARFKNKPCVSFGTHGGGGKVLGVLDNLIKAVKFRPVAPGVMTKGAPDADGAAKARELGKALAEAVR
jgi:flavorubredoxin